MYNAKVYGDWQKDFTLLNDMLFINDTPKGSTDMANRGRTARETTLWEMVMPFWWGTLHPELEHTK